MCTATWRLQLRQRCQWPRRNPTCSCHAYPAPLPAHSDGRAWAASAGVVLHETCLVAQLLGARWAAARSAMPRFPMMRVRTMCDVCYGIARAHVAAASAVVFQRTRAPPASHTLFAPTLLPCVRSAMRVVAADLRTPYARSFGGTDTEAGSGSADDAGITDHSTDSPGPATSPAARHGAGRRRRRHRRQTTNADGNTIAESRRGVSRNTLRLLVRSSHARAPATGAGDAGVDEGTGMGAVVGGASLPALALRPATYAGRISPPPGTALDRSGGAAAAGPSAVQRALLAAVAAPLSPPAAPAPQLQLGELSASMIVTVTHGHVLDPRALRPRAAPAGAVAESTAGEGGHQQHHRRRPSPHSAEAPAATDHDLQWSVARLKHASSSAERDLRQRQRAAARNLRSAQVIHRRLIALACRSVARVVPLLLLQAALRAALPLNMRLCAAAAGRR